MRTSDLDHFAVVCPPLNVNDQVFFEQPRHGLPSHRRRDHVCTGEWL